MYRKGAASKVAGEVAPADANGEFRGNILEREVH